MPAEFVRGDLFGANGLCGIAHGCDCSGSMRKGLSAQFRRRWPALFEEYRCQCGMGELRPGDVLIWREPRLAIFSLAIQDGRRHKADPDALARSLRRMVALAEGMRLARVGLPRVGVGHGGLDWPAVRELFQEVGRDTSVTLVVFERYEPERDLADEAADADWTGETVPLLQARFRS